METLTANLGHNLRTVRRLGRNYLVVPVSMIVPGVLPGSQGPLYYPPDEIATNYRDWEGIPLTFYHPVDPVTGKHLSANSPGVLERQGIGFVHNPSVRNKLGGEAWFDLVRTTAYDRTLPEQYRILPRLRSGRPVEVSTGLYTINEPAPEGYLDHNGRPYRGLIARSYRPDHLAVLPDQVGACSIKNGCGLLVNRHVFVLEPEVPPLAVPVDNWTPLGNVFCPTGSVINACTCQNQGDRCSCPKSSPAAHNAKGKKKKQPSTTLDINPTKACKILEDGAVHDHPLTKAQRGMFGAKCGERVENECGERVGNASPIDSTDWQPLTDNGILKRLAGAAKSFFGSCRRDAKGHCSSGSGGGSKTPIDVEPLRKGGAITVTPLRKGTRTGGARPGGRKAEQVAERLKGGKGSVVLITPSGKRHKIRNGDDLQEFMAAGGRVPDWARVKGPKTRAKAKARDERSYQDASARTEGFKDARDKRRFEQTSARTDRRAARGRRRVHNSCEDSSISIGDYKGGAWLTLNASPTSSRTEPDFIFGRPNPKADKVKKRKAILARSQEAREAVARHLFPTRNEIVGTINEAIGGSQVDKKDGWEPLTNCPGGMDHGGYGEKGVGTETVPVISVPGSLEERLMKVRLAFREAHPLEYDPVDGHQISPHILVAIFDDYTICRHESEYYRQEYTVDEEGEVKFRGSIKPVRQETTWVPVS